MSKRIIVQQEVNYGRHALMYIEDNIIRFDTSDGEYGNGEITIKRMKEIIEEYDESE
jgi:hypothetical protein